eukprot:Rmarinus@m.7848
MQRRGCYSWRSRIASCCGRRKSWNNASNNCRKSETSSTRSLRRQSTTYNRRVDLRISSLKRSSMLPPLSSRRRTRNSMKSLLRRTWTRPCWAQLRRSWTTCWRRRTLKSKSCTTRSPASQRCTTMSSARTRRNSSATGSQSKNLASNHLQQQPRLVLQASWLRRPRWV